MSSGSAAKDSATARPDRRRGSTLASAIYLATLAELAESSFEALSFDKIAARAGAGKASLYRRWNTPAELVLAALTDPTIGFGPPEYPHTGSLRGDLIAGLTDFARILDQPQGRALRPLMTQRTRHPELFAEVQRQVVRPRLDALRQVVRAAIDRGEARPTASADRIIAVGPRLVIMEHMEHGPVPAAEIESIVDAILLPIIAAPT